MVPLLSSCMTNGHETNKVDKAIAQLPKVIDTSCRWSKYILVSKKDVLTDSTARQILAHNETLERLCRLPH